MIFMATWLSDTPPFARGQGGGGHDLVHLDYLVAFLPADLEGVPHFEGRAISTS